MAAVLLAAAACSLTFATCFNPEYGECPFACSKSKCPEGYSCSSQGTCCRGGSLLFDLPPRADSPPRCSGEERSLWKGGTTWEGVKTRLSVDGTGLVVQPETKRTTDSDPKAASQGTTGTAWTAPPTACSCCSCSPQPLCNLYLPPTCDTYKGPMSDLSPSAVSAELQLTGYELSIPAEAEVLGTTATLYRWQSATSTGFDVIVDKNVQLLVAGKPVGRNSASSARWKNPAVTDNCHSSEAMAIYGGDSDLWEVNPPLTGAQANQLGLLLQIENRYTQKSTGYLCSAKLAVRYILRTGELTTPTIELPAGSCWARLEAKTATTDCSTGAVLFDLLGAEGSPLSGLEGRSAAELSAALPTVTATKIKIRVRLRADGKKCNPRLEALELWVHGAAGATSQG